MEIRQYMDILRRWWWLLALCAVIGAAAGFTTARISGPSYSATTTILVYQAPGALPGAEQVSQGQRVADTYAQLMSQRPVLTAVIDNLTLRMTPETLEGMLKILPVRDTNLVEITVTDKDPARAAAIANEVAAVFMAQNVEAQSARYAESLATLKPEIEDLQARIDAAQAELDALTTSGSPLTAEQENERVRLQNLLADYGRSYATLLDRYEQIRLAQAQATDRVSIAEQAVEGRPISASSAGVITVEGALIGLIIAAAITLALEYFNDTVKTKEDVETVTGLPIIGIIGEITPGASDSALVTLFDPNSVDAEAYRLLGANVEHVLNEEAIRTLIVTSSTPLEGKSTTAANIAVSLALSGWQVVVVDMDLRRPTLHTIFQQPNKKGVSSALTRRKGSVMDHTIPVAENLYLMSSGPKGIDAPDLLRMPKMVELIEELKSHADLVILDSPPAMVVADPILIARLADAVLLLVRANMTRAHVLRQTVEIIQRSGARLLGSVLNRVKARGDGSYYYYDYGYYDTPSKGEEKAMGKKK